MGTSRILWFLLVGVMITGAALAAPGWLATGTVTKADGNTLYMLSRGNVVYRVDTSAAKIFFSQGRTGPIRVGDTVRVFGSLTKARVVRAARVRVLTGGIASVGKGPEKVVQVIVEPEPAPAPEAPPSPPCPPPAPPCSVPCWEGKGIVTDIDYVGHQVKIQTSDTGYTVDVDNATMVRGTKRVFLGSLNLGDTIWVSGTIVAANVIDGRMVRVLRPVHEAQGALPLLPVSMVGVIQQIDYPSRTFRMLGPSTTVVVSVDDNTDIYFRDIKKQFNDLKPGTRINMSGNGSLATGYAASYIMIIGGP